MRPLKVPGGTGIALPNCVPIGTGRATRNTGERLVVAMEDQSRNGTASHLK
jgi:hypothetical protein